MKHSVMLEGRTINIELTSAAEQKLKTGESSLKLEMELYFSCLIRKRVLVRENLASEFRVQVNDKLEIGFRPVMTKACGVTETDDSGKPPLTDFPIAKPECYIPHWLKLDYRKGEWLGEFGYIDKDF
jgi:hypothetical protein